MRDADWQDSTELLYVEREYLVARVSPAAYRDIRASLPPHTVIDRAGVAEGAYLSARLTSGAAGERSRKGLAGIGEVVFERGDHLILRRATPDPAAPGALPPAAADLDESGLRGVVPLRPLRCRAGERPPLAPAQATYDPTIADIVGAVSESEYQDMILNLELFMTRNARTTSYEEACWFAHDVFEYCGVPAEVEFFWAVPWYGSSFGCWNVVAEKLGQVDPDKIFIICGHLDSTIGNPSQPEPTAPGADDNASGSAAVLEAARILSFFEFKYTIRFICFGAEEQGLCGSGVYAQNMALAGEEVLGVINLDMLLYGPEPMDVLRINYDLQSQSLAEAFDIAATTYVPEVDVNPVYNPGAHYSDHYSFWVHGYEALQGSEEMISANPHYHSISDVLANYTQYFPFGTHCVRGAVATLAMLAQPTLGVGIAGAGAPAALPGIRTSG